MKKRVVLTREETMTALLDYLKKENSIRPEEHIAEAELGDDDEDYFFIDIEV